MKLLKLSIAISFFTTVLTAQNIGVNTTGAAPHASALLDVDAAPGNNKGLLIPRLALVATNNASPVTSPATSLLVYNTASASTGVTAVSPGYYYWDGVKWVRLQIANSGSSSTSWDVLGNAGTVAGTNFLGTTDNQDLVFKRNNIQAGLLNNSLKNTAFGVNSFTTNAGGIDNVAVGYDVMQSNTTGRANVAIGNRSMAKNTMGFQNVAVGTGVLGNNTIGTENTGLGHFSLATNTTGIQNVAVGNGAMFSNTIGNNNASTGFVSLYGNTTGTNNVAMGSSASFSNTTGSGNVAIGSSAAAANTTGNFNTSVGYQALYNGNASFNTAVGNYALVAVSFGNNNTAVGNNALRSTASGEENAALGISTGTTNATGHRNTLLGAKADVTASNLVNATAIGYNAKVGQNNALILGATGADQVNVGIGTSTPAERFTIENGDMQFGESMAIPGLGRRMLFSDIANNSFDPIFFQRENVANDVSSLNLSIGDNYLAPAAAAPDRFNVGAGYNGSGVFNSIFTVETKNARVGVNTIDPVVDLQVAGIIESSWRTAATTALNSHYAQLSPDGALRLRRNPAAATYSSTNGFIDFVNNAGTGYDFRLSFERNIGPLGSMSFADNANTFMTIAQGTGRVGIAAPTPGGLFELGLDQGRKPATSAWTIVSDERLKTINGNYTKGLKEILQLNTITYHYKNAGTREFQPEVLQNLNVGYSAQEVQKIFPEAVGVDDDGYLNLNMHAILVAYTNAIKEQQTQIEELKKENNEMKKNYEEILKLLKK